MGFEPQKFFIGVVDFFAVLLPGALLTFFFQDRVGPHLLGADVYASLRGRDGWVAFLLASYLLGHFIFLVGSAVLDDHVYDRIRKASVKEVVDRLANGEKPPSRLLRWAARRVIDPSTDRALRQAIRIKEHYLGLVGDRGAINAFQWSKATLILSNPEALAEVHRFEASSKLFRSLVVVLFVLAWLPIVGGSYWVPATAAPLLLLAFWRYAEQRAKATEQAYRYVIAAEAGREHGFRAPPPRSTEPTHGGGVVLRGAGETLEFLLVESRKTPGEWVLPKGHIEVGESPRVAAVREVHEEAGAWAAVREHDQPEDVSFEVDGIPVRARYFTMTWLEQDRSVKPERRWRWFGPSELAALDHAPSEVRELLQRTAERLQPRAAPAPTRLHA